jgi:hypothetical protein
MMNVGMFLLRFVKPLMNQRGLVGDAPTDGIARDENGFIPGTTFKTVEELAKGFQETKADHGRISNEYGNLKKDHEGLKLQAQTLADTLKDTLGKGKEPAKTDTGVDFDKEITTALAELKKLDSMKEDFTERQAELVGKITDLKTEKVKNVVLSEAGKLFQEELKNRDVKTSQKEFLKNNPTFNTPEMQKRINDYIANDPTGMHDKMSAFFALEKEDLAAERDSLKQTNAEMQKALDLQKGKDTTGKVIVKGQSPGQVTHTPKLTGKDLDNAMADALRKQRGE